MFKTFPGVHGPPCYHSPWSEALFINPLQSFVLTFPLTVLTFSSPCLVSSTTTFSFPPPPPPKWRTACPIYIHTLYNTHTHIHTRLTIDHRCWWALYTSQLGICSMTYLPCSMPSHWGRISNTSVWGSRSSSMWRGNLASLAITSYSSCLAISWLRWELIKMSTSWYHTRGGQTWSRAKSYMLTEQYSISSRVEACSNI